MQDHPQALDNRWQSQRHPINSWELAMESPQSSLRTSILEGFGVSQSSLSHSITPSSPSARSTGVVSGWLPIHRLHYLVLMLHHTDQMSLKAPHNPISCSHTLLPRYVSPSITHVSYFCYPDAEVGLRKGQESSSNLKRVLSFLSWYELL